jgi:hypothetical protein
MANFVKAIAMASKDSTTLTGGYDVLTAGLPSACSILRIVNDTDTDVIVSYDGATDHDYIRTGETVQIPAQSNSGLPGSIAQFAKGQPVYLKGTAGVGNIYVAGYYT